MLCLLPLQRLRQLGVQLQVSLHLPAGLDDPPLTESIVQQLEATGVLDEAKECDKWCETLNHKH